MKDLRPTSDASRLAKLAQGSTAEPATDGTTTRRRVIVAVLIAAVLAIVIAPHLLDANRISSVADRAAQEAGGPTSLPSSTCPSRLPSAPPPGAAPPVVLAAAVVCHYAPAQPGQRLSADVVPSGQLPLLNADLRQHVTPAHVPLTYPVSVDPGNGRLPTWLLVGLTPSGERVSLLGTGRVRVTSWNLTGPTRLWRPSLAVQELLAADVMP